jgi:hypothetical protein
MSMLMFLGILYAVILILLTVALVRHKLDKRRAVKRKSELNYYQIAKAEMEIYGRLMPNVDWPEAIRLQEQFRLKAEVDRLDREIVEMNHPKGLRPKWLRHLKSATTGILIFLIEMGDGRATGNPEQTSSIVKAMLGNERKS